MKRGTELKMEHVLIDTGSKGSRTMNLQRIDSTCIWTPSLCLCIGAPARPGHSKYGVGAPAHEGIGFAWSRVIGRANYCVA